jgi:TolB-like protein/class 3 adenylate cyclase/Tfp pilus assembly protein PilF
MTDTTPRRKLAAILAADVVGFSLKMGENENRTLKNLKACRSITDESIKTNHGRIFTTAGDSVIAEFASPVDAIVAAVEFQKSIMARNAACPEEDQMQFRVGLNLGDVIVEGDNLYGDGVNVAARIESSADAGGIHMSAKFYEEVRRKLDLSFENLGDQQLKNISEPISTYRVNLGVEGTKAAKPQPSKVSGSADKETGLLAKLFGTPLKKGISASVVTVFLGLGGYWGIQQVSKPIVNPLSIAVLPFTNLTGDPAQAYVADGMTARVTTDLSRISDALVLEEARASQYKDQSVSAQKIGQELGVRFVLKGDIQRNGDLILINTKLIDSINGQQLWAESFDGSVSDLFGLQDKVTMRISGSLGPKMIVVAATESEMKKSKPEVGDLMLRARALQAKGFDITTLEKSVDIYQKALVMEPQNFEVMAGLASSLTAFASRSKDQNLRQQRFKQASDLALQVLEKDPNNKYVYWALVTISRENDDLMAAIQYAEKNYSLYPSSKIATLLFANVSLSNGETDKARKSLVKSLAMDPLNPNETNLSLLGRTYLIQGDINSAIEYYLKAKQINPKVASSNAQLAVAYSMKGDTNKASQSLEDLKKISSNTSLTSLITTMKPFSASPKNYKDWYQDKFLPVWLKLGLTE